MYACTIACLWFLLALTGVALGADPLRGHGGPVRAIVRLDDERIATAGFDQTIIVWRLANGSAERVLRLHDGAVNALAALPGGCLASGGEDARIVIWCGPEIGPVRVLEGHQAPVSALALSPDGHQLASGAFDRTVRTWDIASGRQSAVREGHAGPVTAVAWTAGSDIVSAGFDATVRLWPSDNRRPAEMAQLPAPVNALAITTNGEIAAAGADGRVTLLGADLSARGSVIADSSPLGALALSPDEKMLAASGLRGGVALIDRTEPSVRNHLVGPGLPVWSLAFNSDGTILMTGGADRVVRFWDAKAGVPLGPLMPEPEDTRTESEERGAVVFRACRACHTLTEADGNRAGPTLHGVFGRRVGTAPGYSYSPALTQRDIMWNKDTIARLFEIGPNAYLPSTKMPEQTITDPADRAALVDWLARETRTR
jgi:cytochrome c